MGPTTRMEYNLRKRQAVGPSDGTVHLQVVKKER